MERAIEAWKALWPDGIPRGAYQNALAIAAIAIEEARRPRLARAAEENTPALPAGDPDLLTSSQVAQMAGVQSNTVATAVAQGRIRASKIRGSGPSGFNFRFTRADAEAWVAARRSR